jgi:hypothetical protein
MDDVLRKNLSGETEKPEKPSIKISGVLAEIRTQQLPNASLERYRYTTQPFVVMLNLGVLPPER